jgi:DNA-binding CsgD family transcriptional regulator/tetratricopeptide (TPR) repeat protein
MPNTRTANKRLSRSPARHPFAAPSQLAGRNEYLDEVLNSAETPASAILVVGVLGSGRSRLLETVRSHASVRSVWAAPHPMEQYRPLAGLSLALNVTGDHRLSEYIGALKLSEPTPDETLAVAADLLALLQSGSREETLLLIDDADQFDQHTQLALTYLAGRLTNTGLRMVLAVRPESTFTAFAGIRSVWISRLDRAQCMELAHGIAPNADAQTLSMVCDACGGLPGMITSTLAHLTTDQLEGHAPLALPLYHGPEGLALNAWEPETVRLLQRLSTAPLCSLSAMRQVRDIDRDRFEQLTSQGVLEINGSFVAIRDGALRSSLYWSMTSSQREELHSLAAIEEEGHSRGLVLWHADHGKHSPGARDSLLDEAIDLYQQGLAAAATEFVERALLLNPTPEDMLKKLLAVCDKLSYLSEFGLARRYLDVCRRAARKPQQLAECLRLEVTIASLADETIDVGAIDVYAHRYRKDSPRTSAELLAFASVYLAVAGDLVSARAHIDRAYRILPAEKVPHGSVQSWAWRYIDGIDGHGADSTTQDDAELEIDELPEVVQLVSGRALMIEEHYAAARHTFRSLALEDPSHSRGRAWTIRVLALSAENEIRAGNIPEASRIIHALAEFAPVLTLRTLVLFAWNEAVVRDGPAAESLLAEARTRARQSHQPVPMAQLLAFEGSLALMRGDLDEARLRLARAYEAALEFRPDFMRMEADFVEVLARRGEWDAARRVAARFAERAQEHPSAWSSFAVARAEAVVAPDDQFVARFSHAIAIAKKGDAVFEGARTRLSFAIALDRFGHGQRANEQRQSAEYAFETLSANGWVNAVRNAIRTIEAPVQNSLLSTLTENELAVLRLMHQGVRNKDIAAALFVSLRTVEVRITQIYRKLEARSRSHLLTLVPELEQTNSF